MKDDRAVPRHLRERHVGRKEQASEERYRAGLAVRYHQTSKSYAYGSLTLRLALHPNGRPLGNSSLELEARPELASVVFSPEIATL